LTEMGGTSLNLTRASIIGMFSAFKSSNSVWRSENALAVRTTHLATVTLSRSRRTLRRKIGVYYTRNLS
jgi:hypothetical protein